MAYVTGLLAKVSQATLATVQYQKFHVHNRARPEALGGIATLVASGQSLKLGTAKRLAEDHLQKLTMAQSRGFNLRRSVGDMPTVAHHSGRPLRAPPGITENLLLPMAYPEGAPMSPSFGSANAAVAGACVTILKGVFQMGWSDGTGVMLSDVSGAEGALDVLVADGCGDRLVPSSFDEDSPGRLSVQGELNKLAANVSMGRLMAGENFYSDCFDGIRLGERIAVKLLIDECTSFGRQSQATLESFDGDCLTLGCDELGRDFLRVDGVSAGEGWWERHAA